MHSGSTEYSYPAAGLLLTVSAKERADLFYTGVLVPLLHVTGRLINNDSG